MPVFRHAPLLLPPLSSAYAAMALRAGTSCAATPLRPPFVASVSISPLALHIRLHLLSCRSSRLPRAALLDWIRRCSASWMRIPSSPPPFFHPLVAATASSALGSPRWSSPPVSPSPPPIPVTLATPGRYYNLTTYDIQRHAVYTSFDAHALSTADLADAFPSADMRPRRRRGSIAGLFWRSRATGPSSLCSPNSTPAVRQIHLPRLWVPRVSMFTSPPRRLALAPSPPTPRTHDDHESAYSLWASRPYAAVSYFHARRAFPATCAPIYAAQIMSMVTPSAVHSIQWEFRG
ncbi:hypothetical protein C8R44DRAFT_883442 [Mycena epipterygia]|nr:hypothetical protein C8R44DRAFT_883442 [Mycena epipterygia]